MPKVLRNIFISFSWERKERLIDLYLYIYIYINFKAFYIKKFHIHNTLITNHKWEVIIGSNLNIQLKLLFCSLVTINNNPPLRIYFEKYYGHISLLYFPWKLFQNYFFFHFSLNHTNDTEENIGRQKQRVTSKIEM